jgi:hypothetical protein
LADASFVPRSRSSIAHAKAPDSSVDLQRVDKAITVVAHKESGAGEADALIVFDPITVGEGA